MTTIHPRTLAIMAVSVALSVTVASADVLFEENFGAPVPAAAKFDATLLGHNWPPYPQWNVGSVTLGQYNGGSTLIRTNLENNFYEFDSSVAVYSVTEINGVQAASRRTGLYARLGETDYSTGYLFFHEFDGANTGFSLYNLASGTPLSTVYFDFQNGGGTNYNPSGAPITMSLTLENSEAGVLWTISYGTLYTASGIDSSVNQVLGGYGTGLMYRNLGNDDMTSSSFSNLRVEVVPEASTWGLLLLGLGLLGVCRFRRLARE